MTKVIGINGSSRKDGNTAIIIGKVFEELNKEGIETELIQLANYEIPPCRDVSPAKAVATACLPKTILRRYSAVWSRLMA